MAFKNLKSLKKPKVASPEIAPEPKNLPAVTSDGAVMMSAGKYARQAVLTVFEQLGGTDTMKEWAEKNQTDFYTKMFAKTITREVEQQKTDSVEELLEAIDVEATPVDAVDAEFEDV